MPTDRKNEIIDGPFTPKPDGELKGTRRRLFSDNGTTSSSHFFSPAQGPSKLPLIITPAEKNFLFFVANCCLADELVMDDANAKSLPEAAHMHNIANAALKLYNNVFGLEDAEYTKETDDVLAGHERLYVQLCHEFRQFPDKGSGKGMAIAGLIKKLYDIAGIKLASEVEGASNQQQLPVVPSIYLVGRDCLADKADSRFISEDADNAKNPLHIIELYMIKRFQAVLKDSTEIGADNQCKAGLVNKLQDLYELVDRHHKGTLDSSFTGAYKRFEQDPIGALQTEFVAASKHIQNSDSALKSLLNMFSQLNNALIMMFGAAYNSQDLAELHKLVPEEQGGYCIVM